MHVQNIGYVHQAYTSTRKNWLVIHVLYTSNELLNKQNQLCCGFSIEIYDLFCFDFAW